MEKNIRKAIEKSFPIVDINRLAIPERNAFKPIYQMHKWFARRASCVFRAILLGAMKPAGTDIMAEFYKDHTNDPDTEGVRILDPFHGWRDHHCRGASTGLSRHRHRPQSRGMVYRKDRS